MQVRCSGVSHAYKSGVKALDDVSIDLAPGVTGLVGVNGAGKSTMLRILSGGLRPSAGSVSVLGSDLYGKGRRAALAGTALMPQELRVPREMRAVDVVSYIGWLRGLSSKEAKLRSEQVLEAVGLAERSDTRVSALSGGMVRRLALAQALVAQPRLLLLDEPTTGLDPEQRAAVRRLVADLPDDGIVLVSSHAVVFRGDVSELVRTHAAASAEEAFLALLLRRRTR
jgi:ABC-type multidrug transport system ATPase subunit